MDCAAHRQAVPRVLHSTSSAPLATIRQTPANVNHPVHLGEFQILAILVQIARQGAGTTYPHVHNPLRFGKNCATHRSTVQSAKSARKRATVRANFHHFTKTGWQPSSPSPNAAKRIFGMGPGRGRGLRRPSAVGPRSAGTLAAPSTKFFPRTWQNLAEPRSLWPLEGRRR